MHQPALRLQRQRQQVRQLRPHPHFADQLLAHLRDCCRFVRTQVALGQVSKLRCCFRVIFSAPGSAESEQFILGRLRGERAVFGKHIEAHARSFLHHQVRNMAGTLKLVGLGRWQPDDVARALGARDRRAGGPTAPAEGLTLIAVRYDR